MILLRAIASRLLEMQGVFSERRNMKNEMSKEEKRRMRVVVVIRKKS